MKCKEECKTCTVEYLTAERPLRIHGRCLKIRIPLMFHRFPYRNWNFRIYHDIPYTPFFRHTRFGAKTKVTQHMVKVSPEVCRRSHIGPTSSQDQLSGLRCCGCGCFIVVAACHNWCPVKFHNWSFPWRSSNRCCNRIGFPHNSIDCHTLPYLRTMWPSATTALNKTPPCNDGEILNLWVRKDINRDEKDKNDSKSTASVLHEAKLMVPKRSAESWLEQNLAAWHP